jgi:CheY-like chemotaxis protein
MDWKMPGMDGIEAAEKIKRHTTLSKIPAIVMVTAYGREEVMQKADRVGLDGFLIKPLGASVLFDTIMQAFGQEVPERSTLSSQRQEADALQNIQGARILLVEDNEINQQVAKEILEGAGFNVALADDGRQAVDAVKKDYYDAILMDVQMPVMDGYEATRKIREWEGGRRNAEGGRRKSEGGGRKTEDRRQTTENRGQASDLQPLTSGTPIIAMTAHAMAGDEQMSLQAGMNDHVTKPIDPDELFAALSKWIKPTGDQDKVRQPEIESPGVAHRDPSVQTSGPLEAGTENDYFPKTLPGFDLAAGLQRLQGNRILYKKLLLNLCANYTGVAKDIQSALDSGDMDQAHHLVHSLKGVAGNLAATDLHAATLEMEKVVKPGENQEFVSPNILNLKLSELQNILNSTLEAVESLGFADQPAAVEPSQGVMTSMPPELAQEVSTRIRDAADMGDITQLKFIAKQLRSQSDAYSPISEKIIQCADDFDFEAIAALADELLGNT